MAKRPSGLGKSSKNKKAKKVENVDTANQQEAEPEIEIELQEEIDDEELAEIYGLYSKLRTDRDPRIARGIVHECNELLKSRDEAGKTLPSKFHIVYSAGLFTLASFEEKDKKEFAKAAFSRLQTGLDETSDPSEIGTAIYELVQFAHTEVVTEETVVTLSKLGQKAYDKAIKLLKNQKAAELELARASVLVMSLMDDLGPDSADTFPLIDAFLTSDNEEIKRLGNKCVAQNILTSVSGDLAELEGDEDEEEDEEEEELDAELVKSVTTSLEKAIKHLKKTLSDDDPDSYVLLAQTYLELSGLLETTEHNDEALKLLKKAQILGVDGLHEIIDSIEESS